MRQGKDHGPTSFGRSVTLGVVGVAIALLVSLGPAGAVAPPTPRHLETRPLVTSGCGTWLSNSSLTATVAELYPNASLLPSGPVAAANAVTAWQNVCASMTFQAGTTSGVNLSFAYTVQALDKNLTQNGTIVGSLFVNFTLSWTAACPSGNYPVGYPCTFRDGWSANLSTLAIAGPISGVASQRLAQCDTPSENESDVYMLGQFYLTGPPPAGVNWTSPAPNESVADQEVATIWGGICSSSAYYDVLLANPTAELSTSAWVGGGAAGSNGTGSGNGAPGVPNGPPVPNTNITSGNALTFQWSLGWDAACPSNMTGAPAGVACFFTESWTANLATDTSTGPVAGVALPSGGTPSTNPGQNGNGQSTSSGPVWTTAVFWVAVLAGVAAIVAAVALVRRARLRRGPT